jgi:hypothetical protein
LLWQRGGSSPSQAAMDGIIERLKWAYEVALYAEMRANKYDIEGAFSQWSEIFKGYFPAYR